MDYREILEDLVKTRIKLDYYLKELRSPSLGTKKRQGKFFDEFEEVEQEYLEAFEKAKNSLGIENEKGN